MRKFTVSKLFIWLRRKGAFRDFLNLDYVVTMLIFKPKLATLKKGEMLMPPIEIITNSNVKQRRREYSELVLLSEQASYLTFIQNKCRLERNQAFRWNAFYPLFNLYLSDKENRYASFICEYLTTWALEFVVKKKKNDFCWYDMADSFRLLFLIDVLSNVEYEELMTKSQKKILYFAVKKHYVMVSSRHFRAIGNHRIFQLVATVKYCEFNKEHGKRRYFTDELLKFRSKQFGDDNVHLEHSPEYHIWASILFSKIFRDYIVVTSENEKLQESINFSRFLFCCNGLIPLIGDSGHEHSERYSNIVSAHTRENDFFFVKEGGYIVAGNDKKGFYFISCYKTHSHIHKHNDSSSYEVTLGGVKVVTDSGKYSYTACSESSLIRESGSHNVFLIGDLYSHNLISYQVRFVKKEKNCRIVCLKGDFDYAEHTRVFFIFECALIVVDYLPNNKTELASFINFSPDVNPSDYFTPLAGVKNVINKHSFVSYTYLNLNENICLKLSVDNVSAYSISLSKVSCFEVVGQKVSFMYKNVNYEFNLSEYCNV